jgi:hypothetical protein
MLEEVERLGGNPKLVALLDLLKVPESSKKTRIPQQIRPKIISEPRTDTQLWYTGVSLERCTEMYPEMELVREIRGRARGVVGASERLITGALRWLKQTEILYRLVSM